MTMNRNQYPCVEFDLDKLAANLAALVERAMDSAHRGRGRRQGCVVAAGDRARL